MGSLKAFHPESLGAWWKHSSRREHVILDSNLLSVLAKGNLFTSSPSNCRKHTTLRHDLKQIANFFAESDDSKEQGNTTLLIHRITMCRIAAFTGILRQHRINGRIHIGGHAFCENQQDALCICSQGRTNSSCQAGPVSQNQIR